MENPYASPIANPYGSSSSLSTDAVSPATIAELAGTKPWVRLISVIMWIACALMITAVVFMLIAGVAGVSQLSGNSASSGTAVLIGMVVGYGLSALLIIYPTLKLHNYASNIGRLTASHSVADLNAALAEQRRYWKFLGILMVIYLCFILLFLLLALAGAGLGIMSR